MGFRHKNFEVIDIKYIYRASNKAGQTVEGLIEAADKKAVLGALRSKSLYLLSLREANPKTAMEITFGSAKIPKRALAIFCTQFASILKSGVPLIQALAILDEQMENKKLKKIVQSVYDDLQRGKGLSDAFSMHEKALPTIMIKMIEAGELSGTLDLSLERLALQFEKEHNMAKKIKSAMMYPTIVCVIALLVVVFMLVFVVPKFMGFFESSDAELPGITKFMLSLSDAFTNGWMYILAGLILIIIGFRFYKSTPNGRLRLDTLKLKAPVIRKSMIRILSARFCRTLATLTSTGITLTQSLRIASKVVSNKLAENKLLDIEESIKQGKSLHVSIVAANIFPSMLMHMTKIGEESGTLDQMLEKAAEYFEDEADTAITKLTTMLQPILLIIVAVIVVAIMLSVLLPIFSIYSSI
ncbi:MAG: type II secretion system F family protein [Eubacteriales bacterium]|nr:type II secretion system F family protein [Eubacteriales bacterium]